MLREAVLRLAATEPGFDPDEAKRRVGLPGCWPGGSDDADPGVSKLIELHNDICLEGARDISRAFLARGLGHFFAKGVALIDSGVYGTADRSLSDIDLYVRPTDCDAAVSELEALGYIMFPEAGQVGPPGLRSALGLQRATGVSIERVQVDLHRALDPLDRLLPRNHLGIGDDFINAAVTPGSLPVPAVQHHCFILMHQLVHSDMLQFHSLIDLASIASDLTADGARELSRLCADARISGFSLGLIDLLEREFGLRWPWKPESPEAIRRWELGEWLRMASSAGEDDRAMITVGRIKRRIGLLDGGVSRMAVLGDVLLPPAEFLRWRWGKSAPIGYLAHVAQMVRKVARR